MIKLDQVKMKIGYSEKELLSSCAILLSINKKDIVKIDILKKAIDARRKPKIFYILNVGLTLSGNLEDKFTELKVKPITGLEYKKITYKSPIIIGFGPSGMFAGLALSRMGLKPIIFEQGKEINEREKDVLEFWQNRKLNKYSNVQFGEGGAGTFSDGKLNSNISNDYCKKVLYEFCKFGAPSEIMYNSKPHIGSDKLKEVVVNIRKEIIALGGNVYFSHKLTDINIINDQIESIEILNLKNNEKQTYKCENLLLCVGHSARDVFELLSKKNVTLKQKAFAMGVRIEQKQKDINFVQYGSNDKRLPPADYKLAVHLPSGRSVFTFCMCPGGEVVSSSSNEGEIVTNGMSNFARDKENANSAVLVNVTPEDYDSLDPLAGIYFQAKYEKLAFELGGGNYNAPAESVGSFLGKDNCKHNINPTYRPNITLTQIEKCLPDFVANSLKEGLPLLNQKLKDFAKNENLLIAIESRSSCPLTILRDENFESNIKGLYPIGEGAGYAGGIISSAQDGIKVAEKIYEKIKILNNK